MGDISEQILTFDEVHAVLRKYLPPVKSQRGAYTLERMKRLMDFLGNPQNSYKVLHVAGTSGKTSTCYYLASLLKEAGLKAGLSVSPHIDEVNERVQVNLKPLAEAKFCREFSVFLGQIRKSGIEPTYFELLTAFALWEFKRQKCDYAVIEVGLGGLLDATNVINSEDKVNILTDIGFDHEEVLGKTLGLIAKQKAGIIKPNNIVICYRQKSEVMDVFDEVAAQQQAKLHVIRPASLDALPTELPLFQRRNWYLATTAYEIIKKRDGLAALNDESVARVLRTIVPARMETIIVKDRPLIMDGSHNPQKLHALTASIRQKYPSKRIVAMISFLATKQARMRQCLEELLPVCDEIIVTGFATENLEKVSADPLKIIEVCEELQYHEWKIKDDPIEAFRVLMSSDADVRLITGSFYLLNHIRPIVSESAGILDG